MYALKRQGQIWATEEDYSISLIVLNGTAEITIYIQCRKQNSYFKWVNAIRKAKRPEFALKPKCTICNEKFNVFSKRHHCRMCGEVTI
jgi:FYVE zinc finger